MPLSQVKMWWFSSVPLTLLKRRGFLKGRAVDFVDEVPRCRSTA